MVEGSTPTVGWSAAALSVWGKTDRDSHASMPLVQHLEDSAAVAGHLWDTWVPEVVRHRLGADVGSHEQARTLATWLAGIHDCGKATPAFAQLARDVQMGDLVDVMTRQGLASATLARSDRLRHTVTGQLAVEEWLTRRKGWRPARARPLASVVGAHHGVPPSAADVDGVRRFHPRAMGDEAWQAVREELLDGMTERLGADDTLGELSGRKLRLMTLIDLSAIVILADWIASDAGRFPYATEASSQERLGAAVDSLDLSPPWRPSPVTSATDLFQRRFPHLAGHVPSALQSAAVDAALAVDAAPLIVIEAPTGSGKSEAALMASEALAARFGCGGVFVALPTMATSNAMFARVLQWVEHWGGDHHPALWLAHGKAQLNEDFSGLIRSSRTRSVFDGEAEDPETGQRHQEGLDKAVARVSGWLFGRKKGLLANVVVGTIDQVLMGALQARHLMLRHLAVSGKVVVIDEVHAVDAYMNSYLQRALEYLGGYGTPVLLLSATLAPEARGKLVAAYQRGRSGRDTTRRGGLVRRVSRQPVVSQQEPAKASPGPEEYPLVTTVTDSVRYQTVAADSASRSVSVEAIGDEDDALLGCLEHALEEGGCVAVLRNTVRRAQETYDLLRQRFGGEVELFHSRFLATERAARERDLLQRLGPDGNHRPERLVIVGTQVLEQSLDIDLDLLITDVAPVDLLVQRMGRLHRHARPDSARPARLRQPRCVVSGVEDWDSVPPLPVSGSRRVYGQALLYRSLAVLGDALSGVLVQLPADAPRLVHRAYDPDLPAPEGWEDLWGTAETRRTSKDERSTHKAGVFQIPPLGEKTALTGWVQTPGDDTEEGARATVRDTEDGIEVIVVQRAGLGLRTLPGDFPGAGRDIPIQPIDRDLLTRQIAGCTVSLPQALTNPARWQRTIDELEACEDVATWQESRWLQGQLVLVLGADLEATLSGHHITYSSERGLEVTQIRQESTDE